MTAGASRGIRAGAAFVEIRVNNSALIKGLNRAQAKLRDFGVAVSGVGRQLVGFSTLAAAPFALATRVFVGFEDQMAQVRAVTNAVDADFEKLTNTAKDLGRTTSFTAQEVAEGMTELGRAGLDASQIIATIPNVLNLARGTSTELGRAAEIAAASMRQFGLSAGDTTRIVDILTSVTNNSSQTLDDLAEGLKKAAPLANEAGEDLLTVSKALAVLANNGIKGSLASNALARAFKNLSSAKTRAKLDNLLPPGAVKVVDKATGNLRPLADILQDIGKATANLGSAARLNIFEEVFGRGQAAALKLAKSGAFTDINKKLQNIDGAAKETARIMDETLGGAFRMMASAVEGVAIEIGAALAPTLKVVADAIKNAAGAISKFVQDNREMVAIVAQVIAVIGAVGAALVAVGTILTAAAFAISVITGAIAGLLAVGTALAGIFAALITPVGLAIAAVVGLGAVIIAQSGIIGAAVDYLKAKWAELSGPIIEVVDAIAAALGRGDVALAAEILWQSILLIWEQGKAKVITAVIGLKTRIVNVFDELKTEALIFVDRFLSIFGTSIQETAKVFAKFGALVAKFFASIIEGAGRVGQGIAIGFGAGAAAAAANLKTLKTVAEGVGISFGTATEGVADLQRAVKSSVDALGEVFGGPESEADAKRRADLRKRQAEREVSAEADIALNSFGAGAVARRRLDELIKKAAEEGEKASTEAAKKAAPEGAKTPEAPRQVDQRRRIGDISTALGTFSTTTASILGLRKGITGVQERTAMNTAQTAENTKKILEELQNQGGATFGVAAGG